MSDPQKSVARQTANRRHARQTFILEPMLTPSALIDLGGEETVDVEGLERGDSLEAIATAETADFSFMTHPEPDGHSGVFTVGESGLVDVDFLFDGGAFSRGEVALFSLEGIEAEPGSREFAVAAAHNALSNSELGQVVIADATEGAKFSGRLGEADRNAGDYRGVQTVQMRPGDRIGVLFSANESIENLVERNQFHRLMFSMAEANRDGNQQFGQVSDFQGESNAFVFEDLSLSGSSDRDYNDVILSIRGAEAEDVPLLDELLPEEGKDWRETPVGQEILDFITEDVLEGDEPVVTHGDRFLNPSENFELIGRVENPEEVEQVEVWVRKPSADDWQNIGVVEGLDEDGSFSFEHQPPLEPGHYEYRTLAHYDSGLVVESEAENFTVLSLPEGEELSDRALQALQRVTDLERYDLDVLPKTQEWVVSIASGEDVVDLAAQFGATNLGATGLVPNTYRWELPADFDLAAWRNWLEQRPGLEYAYPLVSFELDFYNPSAEPFVASASGEHLHQWHLTQSNIADVWQDQIEGSGVTIGIADVGFETDHLDLAGNHQQGDALSYNFDEPNKSVSGFMEKQLEFRHAIPITQEQLNTSYWYHPRQNFYDFDLGDRFPGDLHDLELEFRITHEEAEHLKLYLYPIVNAGYEIFPDSDKRIELTSALNGRPVVSGETYRFDQTQLDPLFNQLLAQNSALEDWNWRQEKHWALAVENTKGQLGQPHKGKLTHLSVNAIFENNHGTLVAGVAAADGDNGQQGSGVAPDADWVALQVGADGTNDIELALALGYANQAIDIYQNSWGLSTPYAQPKNIGLAGDAHEAFTFAWETVIADNIHEGREGKGNVYVFAAGNDKEQGNRVDNNVFANNRYTIAVGAVDHQNKAAIYSNPGASLLISAYSSGGTDSDDKGIVTTDHNDEYTDDFGGTSAAAPFVSGVVALMLEANPQLTWRDVQHILIETADAQAIQDAVGNRLGWTSPRGEHGIQHHHQYGFGLVDPAAAVTAAKAWQPLNLEDDLEVESDALLGKLISGEVVVENPGTPQQAVTVNNVGQDIWQFEVTEELELEAVELVFNGVGIDPDTLDITLTSPSGVTSTLAQHTSTDKVENSSFNWTFTSLRHWGESSLGDAATPVTEQGIWKIAIQEQGLVGQSTIQSLELKLYGTPAVDPNVIPELKIDTPPTTYTEDTPLNINAISVSDHDGDNLSVTLNLTNPEAGQLEVEYDGTILKSSDGVLQIPAGLAGDVNAVLATLKFIPEDDSYADVSIEALVEDGKIASPVRGVFELTGQAENDAPDVQPGQLASVGTVGEPLVITYADIVAATGADDVEEDNIMFTIPAATSGSIDGLPVTLGPGESFEWTPDTEGATVSTFEVVASDGTDDSTPVQITALVNPMPLPQVSIQAWPSSTTEGSSEAAKFMIRRGGSLDEPLTVSYTLTGEATNGEDYETLSKTVTLEPGQSFADISVTALADAQTEGDESVVVRLTATDDYTPEADNSEVTLTIRDLPNTTPTIDPDPEPLPDAVQGQPYPITYEQILAATGATDAEGDAIQFQIPSVSNGTLTVNGVPVVPGTTVIAPGDELVWTPDTVGDGQVGFVVQATDGNAVSDPVNVTFDVAPEQRANFLTPDQPYLSFDDSPFKDEPLSNFHLENFEDGHLNTPGVTEEFGILVGGAIHWNDSVDADDGVVDGAGGEGQNWMSTDNFRFRFDPTVLGALPTHVGFVITDIGGDAGWLTVEAFDAQGESLGKLPATTIQDEQVHGATEHDRFFGVVAEDGIARLEIQKGGNSSGLELDHLQYGILETAPPEPPNTAPTVNPTANPFSDAVQDQPYAITYDELVAATGATDAQGDAIQFQIPSVSNGTLTVNGALVAPGTTVIAPGDELVWTPDAAGDGQTGFVVQATDGEAVSDPLDITFDVAAPPAPVEPITQDVTVTIHRIREIDNVDLTSDADFRAKVRINGQSVTSPVWEEDNDVKPNWKATQRVTGTTIPIAIHIEDDDGWLLGYEDIDVNPTGGYTLTVDYNLLTGEITGPGINGQTGEQLYSRGNGDGDDADAQLWFSINANTPPTLSTIAPLENALQNQPLTITHADLLAGSNAQDADGNPLAFTVSSLGSGSLTKNGVAVTPGTILAPGEALVWVPDAAGDGIEAFRVTATDGTSNSETPIPVTANVGVGTIPSGELTVTINRIREIDNLDTFNDADFRATVYIDGQQSQSPVWGERNDVSPNWQASQQITGATIPIAIQIHDKDDLWYGGTEYEKVDVNPTSGQTLVLEYNTITGAITGPGINGQTGELLSARGNGDGFDADAELGFSIDFTPEVPIPTNHWNASFINRTDANVSDRATYDFTNPVATIDLGEQAANGKISLNHTEMNALDPAIQADNYAMQAWTRTNFEAGQLYKVTTQSDDGVWFRLRDPATGQWLDDSIVEGGDGADWRDRDVLAPPRTIFFKVPATGEYDFYVDYYDDYSGSVVDFTVEAAQPFQEFVNPQTQWQSEVYWWDRKLGNQPPADIFANGGNTADHIGTLNLGSNIRPNGQAGLNFNWGDAAIANDVRLPDNNYAILATTQASLEAGRNYQMRVQGDDGFQLLARNRATGQEVFITPENQWQQAYGAHQVVEFSVPSDGQYDIEAQFYEERGDAHFDLSWEPVNFTGRVISTVNSNLRAGPSTGYPAVGQVGPGQNLTFDKWTTGQFINYTNELGTATNQWYRLAGTNSWISAALINGQP